MYHPRFNGAHYEMGKKLGNIFKKGNAKFPIMLDPFQKKNWERKREIVKTFFSRSSGRDKRYYRCD